MYDWESRKAVIINLYQTQGKTLKEVMSIMQKNYNFSPSTRSYRNQLKQWGIIKYSKHGDDDSVASTSSGTSSSTRRGDGEHRTVGRGYRAAGQLVLPDESSSTNWSPMGSSPSGRHAMEHSSSSNGYAQYHSPNHHYSGWSDGHAVSPSAPFSPSSSTASPSAASMYTPTTAGEHETVYHLPYPTYTLRTSDPHSSGHNHTSLSPAAYSSHDRVHRSTHTSAPPPGQYDPYYRGTDGLLSSGTAFSPWVDEPDAHTNSHMPRRGHTARVANVSGRRK